MQHSSRKLSQGELSLSIIVLAVVIGAAAGYSASVMPVEQRALTAAAAEQTVVGSNCENMIKKSAAEGRPQSSGTQTFQDGKNFKDTCVATLLKENLPSPPNIRSPQSYQCVGKKVTVRISAKGEISETWSAARGVPAGVCNVSACDASGKNCKAANGLVGLNQEKISKYMNPSSIEYKTAEAEGYATSFRLDESGKVDPRTLSQEGRSVLSGALTPESYQNIDAANPKPFYESAQSQIEQFADPRYAEFNRAIDTIQNASNLEWLQQYSPLAPSEDLVNEFGAGSGAVNQFKPTPSGIDSGDFVNDGQGANLPEHGTVQNTFPDTQVPVAPQVPENQSLNPDVGTIVQPEPVVQEFASQPPVWNDPFAWKPPASEVPTYNVPTPGGAPTGGGNNVDVLGGIAGIAQGASGGGQGTQQTFAQNNARAVEENVPRAVWEPQPATPWGPVTRGLEGTPAPVGSVAGGVSGAFEDNGGVGSASAFPGEVVDITQPYGQRRVALALNEDLRDAVVLNPKVESRSLPTNSWTGSFVESTGGVGSGASALATSRVQLPPQFSMTWTQTTFVTI